MDENTTALGVCYLLVTHAEAKSACGRSYPNPTEHSGSFLYTTCADCLASDAWVRERDDFFSAEAYPDGVRPTFDIMRELAKVDNRLSLGKREFKLLLAYEQGRDQELDLNPNELPDDFVAAWRLGRVAAGRRDDLVNDVVAKAMRRFMFDEDQKEKLIESAGDEYLDFVDAGIDDDLWVEIAKATDVACSKVEIELLQFGR